MQVNRLSYNTPNRVGNNKNKKQNNNKSILSNTTHAQNNTSFKGAFAGVDKFCLFIADLIENGGLFVSFTLQDMLGTNLPRPFMGLKRNSKENHGEKNTKFALKELTREMITGPSMFIIPAILISAGKKLFGKATEVPVKFIKSFGDIHAAHPLDEAGKAISKTDFYKNTFTEILKNAKSEEKASELTIKKASEFAKKLSDVKNNKKIITELSDEFSTIVKNSASDAANVDFTKAVVSNRAAAPFKNVVSFMTSYADDLVEKAKGKSPDSIKKYVSDLVNKKAIGRFGANIFIYAVVLSFLQFVPKLYNKAEGKSNAGLKGLMKEETLNDKNLDNHKKEQPDNNKTDKSKPSFGSASSFVDKISGNSIVGKITNGIEFQGVNLSFPLLLGVMGFGILFPRIKNAKDKYDKEEIIRRDAVTCATMCFAEKELRKAFSKYNENKSGFVLATKEKGFKDKNIFKRIFDYLRPIKGVQMLSSDQIISKYSNIDKYKEGIKGFCDFIDGQGGNLSKVFSLTDESKTIVSDLLKKEGKELSVSDNNTIREVLSKAKDSDEIKKLTDLFKNKNNPWVQKAKTINSRFTAFSVLVLVPVFLGFMLPWINEKTTKKRINMENQNNNSAPKVTEFDIQKAKSDSVFSDITLKTK